MPIVKCNPRLMDQAELLVRSVFKSMTPVERLSFLIIKRPTSFWGRFLMLIAGIKDVITFDIFLDDHGDVVGTTGLYRYKKDADEAVWIAWFCVDPKTRGQGIGQQLIEHTVSVANQAGFSRIRLYTSTDPNEAAAQRLYERNGFKEIAREKAFFTTKIFREKKTPEAEQSSGGNH